jgi:galactonate dehydratase
MHYNQGEYDLLSFIKNKDDFKVENGMVNALSLPGIGIEVDEQLVRKAAKESEGFSWRNPVWRGPDGSIREW